MSLGLLIFSAGGMTLMQIAEGAEDPKQKLVWHAILVFWTVFMLKTLYTVVWKAGGKFTVAPTGAPPAGESEDEDAAVGTARRRRPPRA